MIRRQDAEDGEYSTKPYTPISRSGTVGYFEILVKLYEFGELTTYLGSIEVGDYIDI
jgi:NAD(P)H-flavin reductase